MMKKALERSAHIVLNGIRSLLSPAISILLSYFIIHYFSKELWGEFVHYLLYYYIATLICNWGHKDYLLRSFSTRPDLISTDWQVFFSSRLPILLLVALPPLFIFEVETGCYISLWIIATFVSQSIVPIMLYQRDYAWVILIELCSFALLVGLLFSSKGSLHLFDFVCYYAFYLILRSFAYLLLYRNYFRFNAFVFNKKILWLAAPFLFLGLAGFLQSKIDLYTLQFFASDLVLGEYQILSGFFIFSQSIATIVLMPYLKNIYRMQAQPLQKLKRFMILGGFILNLFVNLFILFVLDLFFAIDLSIPQVIVGFVIGYPAYIYALHVFYLFKTNQEKVVLKLSIYGFLINLLVSIVLLSLGQGVTGVLIANASGQVFALLVYTQHKIDDQLLETFE